MGKCEKSDLERASESPVFPDIIFLKQDLPLFLGSLDLSLSVAQQNRSTFDLKGYCLCI